MTLSQRARELFEAWVAAEKRFEDLNKRKYEASEDVIKAEQELAKLLAPDDMKNGEAIGFWINVNPDPREERLLQISKKPPRQGETESYYEVKWR